MFSVKNIKKNAPKALGAAVGGAAASAVKQYVTPQLNVPVEYEPVVTGVVGLILCGLKYDMAQSAGLGMLGVAGHDAAQQLMPAGAPAVVQGPGTPVYSLPQGGGAASPISGMQYSGTYRM